MPDETVYNYFPSEGSMDADGNIPIYAFVTIKGPDGFDTGHITSDDQRDYTFTPSRDTISGGKLRVRNDTFTDPGMPGGERIVLVKNGKSKGKKDATPPPTPTPKLKARNYHCRCTVYYTPRQSGFTAAKGFDMTLKDVKIGGVVYQLPHEFLQASQYEGWGEMTTAINGMFYIFPRGQDDGSWTATLSAVPVGQKNIPLVPKGSTASGATHKIFPLQTVVKVKSDTVQTVFGNQNFTVVDTGEEVSGMHFDLYLGVDDPKGPGLVQRKLPASTSYEEENVLVEIVSKPD